MKKMMSVFMLTLCFTMGFGQHQKGKVSGYRIGAEYTQEFVLDGYVRVREWELQGDKLKLKDLGMTSYPVAKLYGEIWLKKNRSISLAYEHYFMTGTASFNRDIVYNGTIIDGRRGVDVSPTNYNRITFSYMGNLIDMPRFEMRYMVGVVVDHVKFYVDGEVVPTSPKSEVYEGFGRQAFPYPIVGLKAAHSLASFGKINLAVSGTYIPEFESFYTESGNVNLQYSNFQADLSYSRSINRFEVTGGARFRHMHLFQESREDTNVLNTLTIGPYAGLSYNF